MEGGKREYLMELDLRERVRDGRDPARAGGTPQNLLSAPLSLWASVTFTWG